MRKMNSIENGGSRMASRMASCMGEWHTCTNANRINSVTFNAMHGSKTIAGKLDHPLYLFIFGNTFTQRHGFDAVTV